MGNHPIAGGFFVRTRQEKMSAKEAKMQKDARLAPMIRKEIGTSANRRLLQRMPAFRAEPDLPERFRSLLGELERVQVDRRHS